MTWKLKFYFQNDGVYLLARSGRLFYFLLIIIGIIFEFRWDLIYIKGLGFLQGVPWVMLRNNNAYDRSVILPEVMSCLAYFSTGLF